MSTDRYFGERSLINSSHVGRDITMARQEANYICLFKMSPLCAWEESDFNSETIDSDYRKYPVRMYLPRQTMLDEHTKCSRVIIMINGLNEVTQTTQYDQLGMNLAEHGFASILLPLPDHLFRHSHYRNKKDGKIDREFFPFTKLSENPLLLFRGYLQLSIELRRLIEHIQGGENQKKCLPECNFFSSVFEKDCRVSLLGYSLGGLIALSYFLTTADKSSSIKNSINSCFLLNSGAKLSDINTQPIKINKEDWGKFNEELKGNMNKYGAQNKNPFKESVIVKMLKEQNIDIEKNPELWERSHKFFNIAFLGTEDITEELTNHYKRIHFILGGTDEIVAPHVVPGGNKGTSTIQIPNLPHLVGNNEEWLNWMPLISTHIVQLEEKSSHLYRGSDRVLNELRELQKKYTIFTRHWSNDSNSSEIYKTNISTISDKDISNFHELYVAALAYWSPEKIAETVMKKYKVGKIMVNMNLITENELSKALKNKKTLIVEHFLKSEKISLEQKTNVLQEHQKYGFTLKEPLTSQA